MLTPMAMDEERIRQLTEAAIENLNRARMDAEAERRNAGAEQQASPKASPERAKFLLKDLKQMLDHGLVKADLPKQEVDDRQSDLITAAVLHNLNSLPTPAAVTRLRPSEEAQRERLIELCAAYADYRSHWKSRLLRRVAWTVGLLLALWVLVSVLRWTWTHPLF